MQRKRKMLPSLPLAFYLHTTPECCKTQAPPRVLEVEGKEKDGNGEAASCTVKTKVRASKQQQQKPAMSTTKQKKLLREEQDRQQKSMVVETFHGFYKAQYGERWPTLWSALDTKPRAACLVNKFANIGAFQQNMQGAGNLRSLPFVSVPLYECADRFPHPERDDRNIYTCYLLDAASVLATEALELAPEDHVLDLCAAPGGKSLAILQHLNLPTGSLTANDMSAERRRRLWKVIMDYLPEDLRHCISVTRRDGTQWSQPDSFDKALHKRKVDFEIIHRTWHIGEKTEFGWIVLPDTGSGWGPLYFSVLRRIS